MGFLDRLNEIVKPKVHEAEFDFGLGDGPEKVHFRALNALQRQRIIQDRLKVTGKNEKGEDVFGIDFMKDGATVNAELLATCWIRPDGKPVAKKEDFMNSWDSGLVERLGVLCLSTIMKSIGPAAENEEADPSTGQS